MDDSRHTADVVVRTLAGVVGIGVGALWLLFAFAVLSSRFATDPASDPHGFGLIFGTILAVPVGLVCVVTLPFAFPRESRARAFRITMWSFVIGSALLFTAWFTA